MSQLHVAPQNDSKDHVISLDVECWCKPQIQDEGVNQTMIHIPIQPLVQGERNQISKVLLLEKGEKSVFVGVTDKVIRKE